MRQYKPEDLAESIWEISEITCSKCANGDTAFNTGDAETTFFNKGWRATENNTYCPECATKYLKIKT